MGDEFNGQGLPDNAYWSYEKAWCATMNYSITRKLALKTSIWLMAY